MFIINVFYLFTVDILFVSATDQEFTKLLSQKYITHLEWKTEKKDKVRSLKKKDHIEDKFILHI